MAVNKLNLAILISGRGSNMLALIEAAKDPSFPAQIKVVASNDPTAPGLQKAQEHGIPVEVVNHKFFPDRKTFDRALAERLAEYDVDLICLAGFMRILGKDFVDGFEGKIINIHPSLLPDYKGTNTHARALADGKTESGCTVHYVTAELDDGPAIIQKRVPIQAGDTPDTLAARILEQEHIAYPEAIRQLAAKMQR